MSLQDITYFLAALLFVLALMAGLALLLKKMGIAGPALVTPNKRRLKVIENLAVDSRRRIILIKRDDKEHLLLLGQNNDIVIEQNITLSPEDIDRIKKDQERAA
jgi:flagellar protein FliO/FliZ